jgi:hypothetical protein
LGTTGSMDRRRRSRRMGKQSKDTTIRIDNVHTNTATNHIVHELVPTANNPKRANGND